jgi:plastocyanin
MVMPKLFFAVPLVVVGAIAPGFTRHTPISRAPNVVGMKQVDFDRDVITIHEGERIQFVNSSNFLHVIAPGDRARITAQAGVPLLGPDDVRSMPRGEPFLTASWDTPGSYRLTCTLHPDMNLDVVVEP